ncbi:unnamed protein product [Owenia fusiformis]|uniref:Uncharacterized protein n=1 Tax=Owenia fusiformis TaxID=6347 RepID=A0A8J1TVV0_OWEFU|nr:unnamed protein product [Owenia fusiformis]
MEQGDDILELFDNVTEHVIMNNDSEKAPIVLTPAQQQILVSLNVYLNGVFSNIIVALGIIGNILTIVVLTRRSMKSSTNSFLTALAVWDTLVLVCTALILSLPGIPGFTWYTSFVLAYAVSYAYPVALMAQMATIWLTVAFTVERYIAVCHPLKAARMCTIKRARLVISGVSIASILYNIPRWFEFTPFEELKPDNTTDFYRPNLTPFGKNPTYVEIYYSWLYLPVMCIIPLAVLAVMNIFLILAVRKSSHQRKDMNVKQSRENNVTIMLVSVVIVFILCQVPALVYNTAYAINRNFVESDFGWKILSMVRNFLVPFNSSINFLLYCAFGQKFRSTFMQTFCPCCVKHDCNRSISIMNQQNTLRYSRISRSSRGGSPNQDTSRTTSSLINRSSQESTLTSDGTSCHYHVKHNGNKRALDTPQKDKQLLIITKHPRSETLSIESDTTLLPLASENGSEKDALFVYKQDNCNNLLNKPD